MTAASRGVQPGGRPAGLGRTPLETSMGRAEAEVWEEPRRKYGKSRGGNVGKAEADEWEELVACHDFSTLLLS